MDPRHVKDCDSIANFGPHRQGPQDKSAIMAPSSLALQNIHCTYGVCCPHEERQWTDSHGFHEPMRQGWRFEQHHLQNNKT